MDFSVLFSLTWQHDGNRCLQINECKVKCNHPPFSCLDMLTSTVTRKMRNSNLFQKITGTSYETGYLTCKSRRWFITAPMLVCPRFQVSTPAWLCVCVCVFAFVQACEWQPVRERDVIIWLMSVWVVTRGRITSLAVSWQTADRKHFLMISAWEGKHSGHNLHSHCPDSLRGYPGMADKRCV